MMRANDANSAMSLLHPGSVPAGPRGSPARDDHQIYRAVTNDLIGDVSPRALRVVRLRLAGHRCQYHTQRPSQGLLGRSQQRTPWLLTIAARELVTRRPISWHDPT